MRSREKREKTVQGSDQAFFGIVCFLTVFGISMLASASGPSGYAKFGDTFWFVKHQLLFGLLPGAAALLFFSRVSYQRLRRLGSAFLILAIGLLLLVFLPGVGAQWGTSRSWLSLFGLSVQPGEIVKLLYLLYLAAWLERSGEEKARDLHAGLLPFLFTTGIVAGLLLLQPDTGGMFIVASAAVVVFFLGGARPLHLAGILGAGVAGLALLIQTAPYRLARFTTFLHPELDPRGVGYHINQALLAIGSGGIFGLGFGHSRQKFLYLPEVEGDSIFAIIAEELGFVLVTLLIAALVFFAFRGFAIARAAPDAFGKYVAGGITAWIVIQAFVNIAGMLSLLPLTGVTFPFISYGGTSLAVSLAAVGIILNISRYTSLASVRGQAA